MEETTQQKSAGEIISAEKKVDSRNLPQYKEMLLQEAEQRVNLARNWMYFIGAINLIVGAVFYYRNRDIFSLEVIIQAVVGVAFFGFALWVRHRPRLAVLCGLILYLSIMALAAIGDPRTIIGGFLFKILIIYGFIKSMKAASEVENLRDELGKNNRDISDLPIDMIN